VSGNAIYLATVWAIPVIIAITFHEAAHGFVAHLLGDDTAWSLGRVSFNPAKHIDPFGTIVLPGLLLLLRTPFLFGYAKPVPTNFRKLRSPRRDMVLELTRRDLKRRSNRAAHTRVGHYLRRPSPLKARFAGAPHQQPRMLMKSLLVLSVIGSATMLPTAAKAQNYPWCAIYKSGATNCGFTSNASRLSAKLGSANKIVHISLPEDRALGIDETSLIECRATASQ
jgi:hypothetical protein